MKKPHEQEWNHGEQYTPTVITSDSDTLGRLVVEVWLAPRSAKTGEEVRDAKIETARFISAAPDMARALKETIHQVVESHLLILGPDTNSDVIAARGQPVLVTAENFAAMVAALTKAGVLP